uniref:RNase_Zc3h12a domain-containing protein n=1 Tax=Macrostomum lignano TaxID=282301 RepID=A0A1I8JJ13_9PLAT
PRLRMKGRLSLSVPNSHCEELSSEIIPYLVKFVKSVDIFFSDGPSSTPDDRQWVTCTGVGDNLQYAYNYVNLVCSVPPHSMFCKVSNRALAKLMSSHSSLRFLLEQNYRCHLKSQQTDKLDDPVGDFKVIGQQNDACKLELVTESTVLTYAVFNWLTGAQHSLQPIGKGLPQLELCESMEADSSNSKTNTTGRLNVLSENISKRLGPPVAMETDEQPIAKRLGPAPGLAASTSGPSGPLVSGYLASATGAYSLLPTNDDGIARIFEASPPLRPLLPSNPRLNSTKQQPPQPRQRRKQPTPIVIDSPSPPSSPTTTTTATEANNNVWVYVYFGCSTAFADSRAFASGVDPSQLRTVVIDGPQCGFMYTGNRFFDPTGILVAVQWFLDKGHTDVTAFLSRKFYNRANEQRHILESLQQQHLLAITPSRHGVASYEDRFILDYAAQKDGVVVSNDNFRDLLSDEHTDEKQRKIITDRVITFCFARQVFMPAIDPLGPGKPTRDQLLSKVDLAPERATVPSSGSNSNFRNFVDLGRVSPTSRWRNSNNNKGGNNPGGYSDSAHGAAAGRSCSPAGAQNQQKQKQQKQKSKQQQQQQQ